MYEISYSPEGNIRGRAAELKRLGLYSPIFHLPKNYPDEEWLPITEEAVPGIVEGYYVSNYGEVFSTRKGPTLMVQKESFDGYLRVGVRLNNNKGLTINVHRLVMLTFRYFDGCRELQVNHIDANKHNNYIGNLEWCTCAENIHHAVENNLQNHYHGEDCSFAIINNEQADQICQLLIKNKYTHQQIADMVGATKKIVDNISSGCSWRNKYEEYNLANIPHDYNGIGPTDEQLEMMCQYMEENAPYYTSLKSLFTAMLDDLFGVKYDRYTMCPVLRSYYHGTVRKNITQKYHPQLGSDR